MDILAGQLARFHNAVLGLFLDSSYQSEDSPAASLPSPATSRVGEFHVIGAETNSLLQYLQRCPRSSKG